LPDSTAVSAENSMHLSQAPAVVKAKAKHMASSRKSCKLSGEMALVIVGEALSSAVALRGIQGFDSSLVSSMFPYSGDMELPGARAGSVVRSR